MTAEIVTFFLTFVFMLFWANAVLLPITYSLPKAIHGVYVRKNLHPKAIFACLVRPFWWFVALVMISAFAVIFVPVLYDYLMKESIAFRIAQPSVLVVIAFYFLTKSGREDLNKDFENFVTPYRRR